MSKFTQEQQRAYDNFIYWRDKCRVVKTNKNAKEPHVPLSDVLSVVDVTGFNHPFYEANEAYIEYQRAFKAWLAVEPRERDAERMRMSRGDYGKQDSWDERKSKVKDVVSLIKGE